VSAGARVPLAGARSIALGILWRLSPATTRIEIAGSVRRGRADVGDIEIVAVPLIETVPEGMWESREANLLSARIDALIADGILANHPTDPKRGDRYSKLIEPTSGLQLDLFSATADTFGLIYLIRTGPADYSHRFVTDLRRRDLHVSGGQLHRGSLGCGSYVCEVIPTPEETDVYSAAGWKFVRPEMRA